MFGFGKKREEREARREAGEKRAAIVDEAIEQLGLAIANRDAGLIQRLALTDEPYPLQDLCFAYGFRLAAVPYVEQSAIQDKLNGRSWADNPPKGLWDILGAKQDTD